MLAFSDSLLHFVFDLVDVSFEQRYFIKMLGLLSLLHRHWQQLFSRLRQYRVVIAVKGSIAFFAVLRSHFKVIWLRVWFFLVRFIIWSIKANLMQFLFSAFEVLWLFFIVWVSFIRAFLRNYLRCQLLLSVFSSRDVSWLHNRYLYLTSSPLLPYFRISDFVLYLLFISIIRLVGPLSDCLFQPWMVLLLVFQLSYGHKFLDRQLFILRLLLIRVVRQIQDFVNFGLLQFWFRYYNFWIYMLYKLLLAIRRRISSFSRYQRRIVWHLFHPIRWDWIRSRFWFVLTIRSSLIRHSRFNNQLGRHVRVNRVSLGLGFDRLSTRRRCRLRRLRLLALGFHIIQSIFCLNFCLLLQLDLLLYLCSLLIIRLRSCFELILCFMVKFFV